MILILNTHTQTHGHKTENPEDFFAVVILILNTHTQTHGHKTENPEDFFAVVIFVSL